MKLKIPPLLVAIITAGFIWILARSLPELWISVALSDTVTIALIVIGTLVILLGFIEFRRADTTIDPGFCDHSSLLVTTGIYQYTRNPMYLGMAVLLIAWTVYLQHMLSFIVIPVFVAYMNRYQIEPEEEVLIETFGVEYTNYKEKVRRWV